MLFSPDPDSVSFYFESEIVIDITDYVTELTVHKLKIIGINSQIQYLYWIYKFVLHMHYHLNGLVSVRYFFLLIFFFFFGMLTKAAFI